MPTYGSKVGIVAIMRAWRDILVTHMNNYLDEMLVELGEPLTYVQRPKEPHGYLLSNFIKKNSTPVILIVGEGTTVNSEFYSLNAARRDEVRIGLRVQYSHAADPAGVEERLYLLSHAAKQVIKKYAFASPYNAMTCLRSINSIDEDISGESFRQQFRIFGSQNYGRAPENNNETTYTIFNCTQAVDGSQARG